MKLAWFKKFIFNFYFLTLFGVFLIYWDVVTYPLMLIPQASGVIAYPLEAALSSGKMIFYCLCVLFAIVFIRTVKYPYRWLMLILVMYIIFSISAGLWDWYLQRFIWAP